MQVTTEGRPYLGAPLGSPAYVSQFVCEKVDQWSQELSLLSQIANTQPHAAFAAYTHGMQSRWSYLSRTTPLIGGHLQELEHLLRSRLLPNLTGRSPPSDAERNLFALPARLGGLGITVPSLESDLASVLLSALLHLSEICSTHMIMCIHLTPWLNKRGSSLSFGSLLPSRLLLLPIAYRLS